MLFNRQVAKLAHAAGVKLTHPLLGDPEPAADLLQRQAAGHVAFQAGAKADDRPLARFQLVEQTVNAFIAPRR